MTAPRDNYGSVVLVDEDLLVAVPVGSSPWVARVLALAPDGRRVDIAGIEDANGLIIATHRKIGWRYGPNGRAEAQDLQLEDTARQAVSYLLANDRPTPQEDATRSPGERHLDETIRLGSLVHDPTVWPTRPISIDDTTFVLFVTTTSEGQAAVADLGPVRLAIYGSAIPDDLTLRLAQLDSITFEADPDDDESDG